MAAFKDSRLVWLDMSPIYSIILWIFFDDVCSCELISEAPLITPMRSRSNPPMPSIVLRFRFSISSDFEEFSSILTMLPCRFSELSTSSLMLALISCTLAVFCWLNPSME